LSYFDYLILIPARGGSKGIPGKNLTPISGIPLIDFSISAAIKSGISSSKIVLSTDSDEIIDNCKKFNGLEIPFKRPEEISTDKAKSSDVVRHAIRWYKENQEVRFKSIILIQPTSPFRTHNHIKNAVKLFEKSDQPSLISVNPVSEHPCEYIREGEFGFNYILEQPSLPGRQHFPEVLFINGAIYITNVDWFIKLNKFYNETSLLYKMDRRMSIDIDEIEDVCLAESYLKHFEEIKTIHNDLYLL